MSRLTELIETWDGLGVVMSFVPEHRAWIFIALHNNNLGVPVGGTRMRVYPDPESGLLDAMRLAEGMTHKWASINLPFGGGKAVLALQHTLGEGERRSVLNRYGKMVSALGGAFKTGEDLGTTPMDMAFLANITSHVLGAERGNEMAKDPGPYTARGVFIAIRAALKHVYGEVSWGTRTILVQGIGDVGGPLVKMLTGTGARVLISDVDGESVDAFASAEGLQRVDPLRCLATKCDVFSPCAVGGVINPETIGDLQCRIVAGAANNQLASRSDAALLQQRGILYVPDFVANAGGAAAFGAMLLGCEQSSQLMDRVDALEPILRRLFEEADRSKQTPLSCAFNRIEKMIST